MGATPKNQASAMGKSGLIVVFVISAVLLIAAIWSLSRAMREAVPHGAAVLADEVIMPDAGVHPDAIEMQAVVEQRAIPAVSRTVALPPAVTPTVQQQKAVKLQKAKAQVNQLIVERMKQSIRDNPGRDNRSLEKQIQKREKQYMPMP